MSPYLCYQNCWLKQWYLFLKNVNIIYSTILTCTCQGRYCKINIIPLEIKSTMYRVLQIDAVLPCRTFRSIRVNIWYLIFGQGLGKIFETRTLQTRPGLTIWQKLPRLNIYSTGEQKTQKAMFLGLFFFLKRHYSRILSGRFLPIKFFCYFSNSYQPQGIQHQFCNNL